MSEKINFDYNKMTPFKWFIIENYPFLEDSIDGLTNYQLLTKLGDEINKNRDSINELGLNAEALTEGYNSLVDYVNNYFNNLDVQDEINNKLDQLVQDGTLVRLIGAYIQPRIDAQNQNIENKFNEQNEILENQNEILEDQTNNITAQNAKISQIDNKVNSVASGSPLVASSTAGMSDTSKTYVNTSDGKWYYYNGTTWTVGGTYQSTGIGDGSVTKAKLNSDLLKILQPINNYLSTGTDLNTIVDSGTYVLMSGIYSNCFTTKTIKTSILIVERAFTGTNASDPNQNVIVQTIINREKPYEIHKRTIYGTLSNLNFKDWVEVTTDNDYYQIPSGANLNDYFNEGKGYLLSGTYTNAPKATMPTSIFKVEKVSSLKGDTFEDNAICCLQTIIPRDGSAYYIRSIYYQYDNQSAKHTTPWVNIINNAQKESLNILTLGDSIIGMPNQYITDAIGNYTSGNVYNCNFGGTTAVDRTGSHFQAFSFVNLVDAKTSNTYILQDTALSYDDIPDYFSESLTRFKNVDMSSIDICLVMYGTNDFNSNYPIGNVSDNNKTSILGSLRYGIEKLAEEYPNIRFIILNPIFRVFNNDATKNSKTYSNTNNEKLIDVDTAEINLANDMLISNIDMIKIGINENNYSYWLVDGVHFKDTVKSKIGSIIANNILNL